MPEPFAPLLTRLTLLGGTEETTSGTAATVTAAFENTTCYDIKLEPLDFFADGERMPDGLYLGQIDAITGKQMGRLTWRQDLRNADAFISLLTGCGYAENGGALKPTSDMSARKTWTFAVWENGRRKGIKGAAGTCKISGQNGGRATAEFDFTGVWVAPIAEAMPSQEIIQTTSYLCQSMTLNVGGSAAPMSSKFEVDLGNSVVERASLAAASGVLHMMVGERKPTLTLDTEARLVGDNDVFGAMLAGTTGALALTLVTGATSLTIAGPRLQRRQITNEERNRKRIDNTVFAFNADEGDDEISFTEV